MPEALPGTIVVGPENADRRLDQFLAAHLDVSRARVQQLISEQKVSVDGQPAKASLKLRGDEHISIVGPASRPPLKAIPEEIPLDIVFEDDDLAIINKPAGMMVHAGAGATEDARNRGTLVNALLHHFSTLSAVGGEMRPGIVHRLDKETSGLIVVAKNDESHRKLQAQFAQREVKKKYIALVQGSLKKDGGTVSASISRDRIRRTRMTTRQSGGREAVSHYKVLRRIDSAFGKFTLVEVKIDTGRTHQIRVYMASLGHPVVGDTLYGAAHELRRGRGPVKPGTKSSISLSRNFLHAAELELAHPPHRCPNLPRQPASGRTPGIPRCSRQRRGDGITPEADLSVAAIIAVSMKILGAKLTLIAKSFLLLCLACAAIAMRAQDTTSTQPAQAGASATQAQDQPEQKASDSSGGSDQVPTIRTRTNEVNVVFTVTDKHGRRITDLKQNDFRIVDDNKPPDEIRSFHAETNLPLQVGLLIDASNSVRDRFKFEQESAIEFLNQIIHPQRDKAFVIGFDVTPEVTQDFTDNTEALAHGVHDLRPGGGTALYDALYYACRDKLLKTSKGQTVRRAIILLSDGDDNQSHVTREEAIEMAQRAEAIVYTISTNVSGSKGPGDKVLERIADATGGRAFFPFQLRDVSNDFAEIQDELRSQYAVSYKPADFKSDGHYRTIEIVANDRKNFRVRSRRGYYAPGQ